MNVSERVLTRARELVETPDKWSPSGPGTAWTNGKSGTRCCLYAIQHAAIELKLEWMTAGERFKDAASEGKAEKSLIGPWNDVKGRTHEEVLKTFDKAIMLSKMEGP